MIRLSICLLLGGVCMITAQTFAAYGGGGSSISKSSVSATFLTKDVCPNGDTSQSYYDGTCGTVTSPEMMFTTQSVQSVEKKTATDYLEEAKKLKEKLIEKKEQLTTTGVQPYVEDMPPKYLAIQLKVAKLLAPWQKLSEDERNKKVVVLLKKIDKLQQSTQLSEKMRMVITYVQNVAIMMASF